MKTETKCPLCQNKFLGYKYNISEGYRILETGELIDGDKALFWNDFYCPDCNLKTVRRDINYEKFAAKNAV